MLTSQQSPSWLQRSVVLLAFVAVVVHGYIIAFVRVAHIRDFDVHRILGQRFLTHFHLYDTGYFGYPYMPMAAMYFAPLALFTRPAALALRYAVAVLALILTLVLLHRFTRDYGAREDRATIWIAGITVVLALQFILQDLDDGGPHLILLGILTVGIYWAWQGREKLAAILFGFAIAVKVTSALFALYFLWKRRWRLAAYTAVATVCWICLPMVYMGPEWWWMHQQEWTQVAVGSFIGNETPATRENEHRVRNQSLRHTLMRYLVALPDGDPLRAEDPGYVPFLNLPAATARTIATALMASLVVAFLWWSRGRYKGRGDPVWVRETSAVMIIALLMSPVTWVQHVVWLVPALYVIVSDARMNERLRWGTKLAFGVYILLTLVLNYELLGKRNFERVLSYHPYAIAMLVVLGMLIWRGGVTKPDAGWYRTGKGDMKATQL
jgi:alpha-1,2-mannosyltransferase